MQFLMAWCREAVRSSRHEAAQQVLGTGASAGDRPGLKIAELK